MTRHAPGGLERHPRGRPAVPDYCVDLATGNPDPALLPSLDAALRSIPTEPTLYGEEADLRALIAFARAELAADGIAADAVLVTNGAFDAIDRVLRDHVRAGDRIVVEDPGYPGLFGLVAASGLHPEAVAIDDQGPAPDALGAALSRRPVAMIVTPRAQNPTGASFTAERATALRNLLERFPDVLIIENDPLGPIAGAPYISLTTGRTRWAIVRSTSKFLGPDLRVALLAGDPMTVGRVRARLALGPRRVSHLLQYLALALWSDPAAGRQLARAAEAYGLRRHAFVRAMQDEGIQVVARSGFNVWVPVRREAEVVQRLIDQGWAVAAGEPFRLRSGPGLRVTTSALAVADAPRVARALAEAVRSPRAIRA